MSTTTPPPPPPPAAADSDESSSNSLARIIRTTLSYDTNVMLAAIISLLLVILFVLLLHLYTRWFLVQARRRSRTSVTVPHVLGSRLHHRFTIIDTGNSPSKLGLGLPFSIISSLPLFVYKFTSKNEFEDRDDYGLECAICLSVFEEEEIGRKLPDCGHAFHVECIDMWLNSHSTCPICRSSIQFNNNNNQNQNHKIDHLEIEIDDSDHDLNVSSSSSTTTTIDNEDVLRLEIVTTITNQISTESRQTTEIDIEIVPENDSGVLDSSSSSSSSSSSIGESLKKFINNSSSCSCSSRSGGKIHPSSNVNGDESNA